MEKDGKRFELAEEYIGKILIDDEIRREGKRYDSRLTSDDLKDLGPARAMGVFTLSAFGEDADRDGFADQSDFRGYGSEFVEAENGGVIANLYGKVLVGPLDAEDGTIDREGAIRFSCRLDAEDGTIDREGTIFSCRAELGMGKKVNGQNNRRNLVVGPNTLTPKVCTGRRIYIRPK